MSEAKTSCDKCGLSIYALGGAEAIRNVMHHSPESRAELMEKFERHWAANRELIALLNECAPHEDKE